MTASVREKDAKKEAMGSRLIVMREKGLILTMLLVKGRLMEMNAYPAAEEPAQASICLGSIYIGKVMNVASNIRAAFVELSKGERAFLPLTGMKDAALLNRKYDGRILAGDEILVQVAREAVSTKEPVLTTEISISGRYAVAFLANGTGRFQFSSKLEPEVRISLENCLHAAFDDSDILKGCSLIIRTNAGELTEYAPLIEEIQSLAGRLEKIRSYCAMRTCYSCLYRPLPAWLTDIRDTRHDQFEEIVTDDLALYQELKEFLEQNYPMELSRLRYYADPSLSLSGLYNLASKRKEAFERRVWLKSGGYLVIEPTEALTVIDVNSGKYIGKKAARDTFRLINAEAAVEIARQLRLRNLSGIILVDFINMERKEDEKELMHLLALELKKDPIKAAVIDMTPLGLVELTRKKVRKPLREQMAAGRAEEG